jgi:hypothetical protein
VTSATLPSNRDPLVPMRALRRVAIVMADGSAAVR